MGDRAECPILSAFSALNSCKLYWQEAFEVTFGLPLRVGAIMRSSNEVMLNTPVMRVARPTDSLAEIKNMYVEGQGLFVLGEFAGHDGFDGVMLGDPNQAYHIEFTSKANHACGTAPSADHLLVFYLED